MLVTSTAPLDSILQRILSGDVCLVRSYAEYTKAYNSIISSPEFQHILCELEDSSYVLNRSSEGSLYIKMAGKRLEVDVCPGTAILRKVFIIEGTSPYKFKYQ